MQSVLLISLEFAQALGVQLKNAPLFQSEDYMFVFLFPFIKQRN